MERNAAMWLILAAGVVSCQEGDVSRKMGADDPVEAFFEESLYRCEKNSDCASGLCDLTAKFTVSVSSGYCMSFPNAFDRWQRIALAMRAGEVARSDPELRERLLSRVDQKLNGFPTVADKEAMAFVLRWVGTQEALERLRLLHDREKGAVRRLAGLLLAAAGDASGEEDMVQASQSAVVRTRLYAVHAAAGLCNESGQQVLAVLRRDPHPLVREAARRYDSLSCGSRSGAARK